MYDFRFTILFVVLFSFCFVGCQNSENSQKSHIVKKYGNHSKQNDSLSTVLDLKSYNDFKNLLNRTEEIVCNDSIPTIVLNSKSQTKKIYLSNGCWENLVCGLVFQRNMIQIENDSITKLGLLEYPIDSLQSVLTKDLNNKKKDPRWSDSSERLGIYISSGTNEIAQLQHLLHEVTLIFDSVPGANNLNITLNRKIVLPPIPPLPTKTSE